MFRNLTVSFAGLALLAALAAPAFAADKVPAYVTAAVADAARPDKDKEADADRKPAETIAFVGIKPGDKVGELMPGGGYFTRIIAKTVGPKGHVYTINPMGMPERMSAGAKALAADPAYAGIVTTSEQDLGALKEPEALDVVWTSRNYHDLHNPPFGDVAAMNKAIFAALKPGGIYLVLDHAAKAGSGTSDTNTLHRIDPAAVKTEVLAAGFVLDGQSDVLQNKGDDHTAKVFDSGVRGKTDQFILKFRKPK